MTSTLSFVPRRQGTSFLICGDTKGKYRQTEALNLCMSPSGALPGLRHLEQPKDGLWAQYIIDDGTGLNQEDLRVRTFRGIEQDVSQIPLKRLTGAEFKSLIDQIEEVMCNQ